jgi:hypothetical protein
MEYHVRLALVDRPEQTCWIEKITVQDLGEAIDVALNYALADSAIGLRSDESKYLGTPGGEVLSKVRSYEAANPRDQDSLVRPPTLIVNQVRQTSRRPIRFRGNVLSVSSTWRDLRNDTGWEPREDGNGPPR